METKVEIVYKTACDTNFNDTINNKIKEYEKKHFILIDIKIINETTFILMFRR